MSDGYDRLIEGRLTEHETDIRALQKDVTDIKLWLRTVLAFVAGLSFTGGLLAKPVAELLQKMVGLP